MMHDQDPAAPNRSPGSREEARESLASARCVTCLHWLKPSERTDFRDVVNYHDPSARETGDYEPARRREDEADKRFGRCQRINLEAGVDLPMEQEPPLALCRDGSEYKADLYTQATFGCVLWEPAHAG